MRPITLEGFEKTFGRDDDPWCTFADADEALKRAAILHAVGSGPLGRVLELGAGNGSNSVALAPRAHRRTDPRGRILSAHGSRQFLAGLLFHRRRIDIRSDRESRTGL